MWSKSWFSALIPHTVIIFTNFVASRSNKWANSFRLLGTRYLFSTFCTRNHSQEDSNLDHQSRRHMCSSVYHHNSSVLNYVSLLSNMKVFFGGGGEHSQHWSMFFIIYHKLFILQSLIIFSGRVQTRVSKLLWSKLLLFPRMSDVIKINTLHSKMPLKASIQFGWKLLFWTILHFELQNDVGFRAPTLMKPKIVKMNS